jgi:hypothetical protein
VPQRQETRVGAAGPALCTDGRPGRVSDDKKDQIRERGRSLLAIGNPEQLTRDADEMPGHTGSRVRAGLGMPG